MVLYYDTETTGLYPGNICQLSYIMQRGDNTVAKNFYFSVDFVEYGALAVHGLTTERLEKLSGGKWFACFADEIERDFLAADVVVGHNVAFDNGFMSAEFKRTGKDFFCKHTFCTMKKFTPVCKLAGRYRGYKHPRLNELCAFLGISEDDIMNTARELFGDSGCYHDARFDTAAVYLAVNRAINSQPALDELKEFIF